VSEQPKAKSITVTVTTKLDDGQEHVAEFQMSPRNFSMTGRRSIFREETLDGEVRLIPHPESHLIIHGTTLSKEEGIPCIGS